MIYSSFFLVFILISSYSADESCRVNTADREIEEAEKCLIMLKPDTVNRGLVGEFIQRFEKKGFTKVLQFLIYFVDTLRSNNVVWGVGRGSSVSSFCLFLIGVHKINPLLYNLDYREFLR